MNITIIGAGNGGLTSAYWASKNGHEVMLVDIKKFSTQIKKIKENNSIIALKEFDGEPLVNGGTVKNIQATTDFKKALDFSDILIMICPSFAQKILMAEMLPFLKDKHIIVSLPGNYATLALTKFKNDQGYNDLSPTFVDGITIPFACRIIKPGEVAILGVKKYVSASIWSEKEANKNSLSILEKIFNLEFRLLENPIVAGLENINYGGHPLMTICNIGLLENFNGKFVYYKDCSSPATAAACKVMDEERLKIGKAFGWKLVPELEAMNSLYDDNAKTVHEFNRASITHAKLHNAPNSSKHRYITEDTAYLLVPICGLAKKAGFKLPVAESLIILAGAYNTVDYFKEGRNLEELGIQDLSFEEIKKMFK